MKPLEQITWKCLFLLLNLSLGFVIWLVTSIFRLSMETQVLLIIGALVGCTVSLSVVKALQSILE